MKDSSNQAISPSFFSRTTGADRSDHGAHGGLGSGDRRRYHIAVRVRTERHGGGDHAILRRSLCDGGLVSRTRDGRVYRRVERRPPPEAAALICHLKARVLPRG